MVSTYINIYIHIIKAQFKTIKFNFMSYSEKGAGVCPQKPHTHTDTHAEAINVTHK